jgi:hypothetical protein
MEDRSELKLRWIKLFQEGLDNDSWGQVIEANAAYEKYNLRSEEGNWPEASDMLGFLLFQVGAGSIQAFQPSRNTTDRTCEL